jgi:deoxyribonuclease-2
MAVAIKLPNGKRYIEYSYSENENKEWLCADEINDWITKIFSRGWTNWLVYNDQTTHTTIIGAGHCKGIVVWNKERSTIGWLCHSVPFFPTHFNPTESIVISPIRDSEYVYGQSFFFVQWRYTDDILVKVKRQLKIMNANIYIQFDPTPPILLTDEKPIPLSILQIHPLVSHVAKSPSLTIDIYSEYLSCQYNHLWYIESWRRGSPCLTMKNIIDVDELHYKECTYKNGQDHSKWAVSTSSFVWIGDLNRMTTQMKRGGGGFICDDVNLAQLFRSLV